MNTIDWKNLPTQTTPLNKTMLDLFQSNINNGKIDKSLPSYTGDLNDIDETGYVLALGSAANKPETVYSFIVNTMRYTTVYKAQVAIKISSTGEATTYQRVCYNGTWKPWLLTSQIAGTWTPQVTTRTNVAPTIEYSARVGTYKKIGDMVFISFLCRGKITAFNETNHYGAVSGLPFKPIGYSGYGQCGLSPGIVSNLVSSTDYTNFFVRADYNGIIYLQHNNGGSAATLKLSGDSEFVIGGSGWYETA